MRMGPFVLLLFGTAAYKLRKSDVQRIEAQIGKSSADLTEDELLSAMKKLGIKKLELAEEDEDATAQAD